MGLDVDVHTIFVQNNTSVHLSNQEIQHVAILNHPFRPREVSLRVGNERHAVHNCTASTSQGISAVLSNTPSPDRASRQHCEPTSDPMAFLRLWSQQDDILESGSHGRRIRSSPN